MMYNDKAICIKIRLKYSHSVIPLLGLVIKMKNKIYRTSRLVPKFNRKIEDTEANSITPNTHIHVRSLSLLGTGTSIKSGGFNITLLCPNLPSL
jgi:hypothetical protein